ncbi:MAG TPA: efflux RND transporter periplasmic adaptor subunit [Ktedonobacteraceae bacterium]|nr:efflux RND transporter periplasmic adaptor subunit [Ktedonobacteraceae bacterium]
MMNKQLEKSQFQPLPNRSARLPIETVDTCSLWAAHQQEAPFARHQTPVHQAAGQVAATPPRVARTPRRPAWQKNRRLGIMVALGIVSLACLVSLVSLAAWRFMTPTMPDVTLYHVSMKRVSLSIGGGGIAYPVQRLDISYPFTAHVLSVFVKPGDRITPNQSLVQIDLSQVNGQRLSTLQAQVAQAYQDMLASQSYYYSVLKLGNPIVVAQAQQQYTAAQAQYDTLVAEEQAPDLHQGRIDSTIAGVVTAVNVFPGQLVGANQIMLTIFDEASVIVRVQVPLSNYGQVQINQPAQATPSALPGQSFNGTVIAIIPNVNPQSGTFEAWIMIPNTNGTLLPGSNIYVRIQNTVNALVVPRLAVLNPDLDSTVYVVRQQQVHLVHVQVSGYAGDSVLIASGLQANDLIVLVGLDSLQDGQAVHVTGIES